MQSLSVYKYTYDLDSTWVQANRVIWVDENLKVKKTTKT